MISADLRVQVAAPILAALIQRGGRTVLIGDPVLAIESVVATDAVLKAALSIADQLLGRTHPPSTFL